PAVPQERGPGADTRAEDREHLAGAPAADVSRVARKPQVDVMNLPAGLGPQVVDQRLDRETLAVDRRRSLREDQKFHCRLAVSLNACTPRAILTFHSPAWSGLRPGRRYCRRNRQAGR